MSATESATWFHPHVRRSATFCTKRIASPRKIPKSGFQDRQDPDGRLMMLMMFSPPEIHRNFQALHPAISGSSTSQRHLATSSESTLPVPWFSKTSKNPSLWRWWEFGIPMKQHTWSSLFHICFLWNSPQYLHHDAPIFMLNAQSSCKSMLDDNLPIKSSPHDVSSVMLQSWQERGGRVPHHRGILLCLEMRDILRHPPVDGRFDRQLTSEKSGMIHHGGGLPWRQRLFTIPIHSHPFRIRSSAPCCG